MIHPSVITRGPPVAMPNQYDVIPPARMEMIEKLMAKLLNQPSFLFNSWAKPFACSGSRSKPTVVMQTPQFCPAVAPATFERCGFLARDDQCLAHHDTRRRVAVSRCGWKTLPG